jgi:hypothetical protein
MAREPQHESTALPGGMVLIGRREYLEFPEWGVGRVRVKVDTGAYSSALHVAGYDLIEDGGVLSARLRLVPRRRQPEQETVVLAPVLRLVNVASTCGGRQRRPLIEALVRLGPFTRRIRLTVTDRAHLRHRMILGRQALAGQFLVDVSRKYLLRP